MEPSIGYSCLLKELPAFFTTLGQEINSMDCKNKGNEARNDNLKAEL